MPKDYVIRTIDGAYFAGKIGGPWIDSADEAALLTEEDATRKIQAMAGAAARSTDDYQIVHADEPAVYPDRWSIRVKQEFPDMTPNENELFKSLHECDLCGSKWRGYGPFMSAPCGHGVSHHRLHPANETEIWYVDSGEDIL
jgi:hypothetical protein